MIRTITDAQMRLVRVVDAALKATHHLVVLMCRFGTNLYLCLGNMPVNWPTRVNRARVECSIMTPTIHRITSIAKTAICGWVAIRVKALSQEAG
jgi:hypothetical protein